MPRSIGLLLVCALAFAGACKDEGGGGAQPPATSKPQKKVAAVPVPITHEGGDRPDWADKRDLWEEEVDGVRYIFAVGRVQGIRNIPHARGAADARARARLFDKVGTEGKALRGAAVVERWVDKEKLTVRSLARVRAPKPKKP